MPKTILEQLNDLLINDDEALSNHTFARIMLPFFTNHLPHMGADIEKCKLYIKIHSAGIGIIITILLAILGILLANVVL